jgi:hypothetical protein
MTDTPKASQPQKSAVVYVDGKPCLELAADRYIYPINTPDDQFKLYVAMRVYEAYAIKKFYDQIIPKRKRRTTAENTVETPDMADMRTFVLDHFESFTGAVLADGSAPGPEQQKLWLEENSTFLERIFRLGIDSVGPRERPDEARLGKAILLFGQKEQKIHLEFRLYSPERKFEEVLRPIAIIDKLTQSDKHQYDKAISIIENSRRGETYTEANWDVIEQLCNQRLKCLEGAVIDGQPCTAINKESWVKRLLLIPKIYIMSQAIQDVEIKNA